MNDNRTTLKGINKVAVLGQFSPSSLAFARSCWSKGIMVYLIEINDTQKKGGNYSSCIAGGININPEIIGTVEGVDFLRQYCLLEKIEALIALSEERLLWLSKNRKKFEPECKLLMPSYECLEYVSSKEHQIKIALQSGFHILPTCYLNKAEDCQNVSKDLYPLCVRPSIPEGLCSPFKAKVFYTSDELARFLKTFKEISAPIIAQPFLQLPDMKVHGARSENCVLLALKPFLAIRKFEGVTLTLSQIEFPVGVKECCEEFIERAGITGCFHFDFLYSEKENKVYYLEINTRMGGITDKALVFGYDQPGLFLRSYGFKGKYNKETPKIMCRRVVNKRSIIKHIVSAIRGEIVELDYPPISRTHHIFKSILDLLFAKDSVFSWRDFRI